MAGAVITAVDSSVLFDVLANDPTNLAGSLAAMREARRLGAIIACPVVWAEVRAFFSKPSVMTDAFLQAGIGFDPFDLACADLAGETWKKYRSRGGTRTRLVPDFLVGAHAQVRGGRLLTRDRGFFRRYFTGLRVIEPTTV